MPLLDNICEEIVRTSREARGTLEVVAAYRMRCEGWFKVEVMKSFLQGLPEGADVQPEADYVDLTVTQDSERIFIQLKTFPTNYGSFGKPITDFIDEVIADLQKLTMKSVGDQIGLAVWLAYPIPEPEPAAWKAHLRRIRDKARNILRSEKILLWEGNQAHLYITESPRVGAGAENLS